MLEHCSPIPLPFKLRDLKFLQNQDEISAASKDELVFDQNCMKTIMTLYNTIINYFVSTKLNKMIIEYHVNPEYITEKYTEEIFMRNMMAGLKELFPDFAMSYSPCIKTSTSWFSEKTNSYTDHYLITVDIVEN